ncbi:MAG: hypothetical protein JWP47_4 [Polaromonas sp.]|nr:hypothetical protein [Polaromonas sp.]
MRLARLIIVWLVTAASTAAYAFDLTVTVLGAATARGSVRTALYTASDWLKDSPSTPSQSAPALSEGTRLVYRGLPAGRYAISAFHDQNDNRTLDTYPLGIPREAYSFSRDARGVFGPPAFSDAAFDLHQDAAIVVHLR